MSGSDTNVLATSRPWAEDMVARLAAATGTDFKLVRAPAELTVERLQAWAPRRVYFPHWSSLIPREIFAQFECVIFHMTDLPFGRGGSPLQNLIARGIYHTKVSALRCEAGLDTGPIYVKRDLALDGSAREIFARVAGIVEGMILEIATSNPQPVPQTGEPTVFKRRRPEEGNVGSLEGLQQVYDYIRMLDGEGYPPAFIETGRLRLEFSDAVLTDDGVQARVLIRHKPADPGGMKS